MSVKTPRRQDTGAFLILIFAFLLCGVIGCGSKSGQAKAKQYEKKIEQYFSFAEQEYKKLKLDLDLGGLYLKYGQFEKLFAAFKNSTTDVARQALAIAYYKTGDYTDALETFEKAGTLDNQALYYFGKTCEKLSLYDKAMAAYRKISSGEFYRLAQDRLGEIEKAVNSLNISQIDPQVYKIITQAPLPSQYPQAGALILSCDEKIEITPENTQISTLHYIIKIINQRGKENFSETKINYDSTYEKVDLEFARVIKPEGTVVDVGRRHIRDVSLYLNFPLYSNARVFIISFPEIAEGSVIEYKAVIRSNQLVNKKDFVVSYPLQAADPIIAADFKLSAPKERKVNFKKLNEKYNNFSANLDPQAQNGGNSVIYKWQFKNIPQIIPEPNMPPDCQVNPQIMISSFNSWGEVYQWWWGLAKDKIKADQQIKNKIKELTSGLDNLKDKIKAVYNFCAKDIRYVGVEYGQAGYEPHAAEDIFRNKYGDCKDKAVLLVTMLSQIGAEADLVLIATRDNDNLMDDFASIDFNHCIAAVELQGEVVFLDPTAETCSFGDLPVGDQERRVLLCSGKGYKIMDTPLYPAEHNLLKQVTSIRLNADESIAAKKTVFTNGFYDQTQRYWLIYTPPELIEQMLKEKIQEISIGAKLNSYSVDNLNDLNKPVVLTYEFSGKEYLIDAGNLRIVPQLSGLDTAVVAQEKRKYPIDFSSLDSQETDFVINIPDGFNIAHLPDSVTQDSPWLKFDCQYKKIGNNIYFTQKVLLKKNTVSQEEYPAFKEFMQVLAKKVKQRIVLRKK